MFDPTIGRWQTKDPKRFDSGDTNLYRYVGNHPSYATDPSGLEEIGKLRSIPRSMLSELQEIHPPLLGETEADYLGAMGFVIQDLPEPVYDVKGKKILYPFSSERRGGFIDGVYYVDRWRTGNLEQPCVVCHGRDAFGLLPGLSTTDSFVGGAWYHSGSPGNIVGNQSAGVGSGIFNFFVGLGNIGGYGYQGLSGQDFEELIDSEAGTEWIRNAIYPDRDPGSLLTTSGEIFGQIVTGEVFGFALGSLISNSNKLNWIGAPVRVGRVFTSTDAHVGSAATQLDALLPGRVLDVNKHLSASVAGGTREVDILMDQFIIQVKGGRANGLAGQMQQTAATLTDKSRRVIGYAPDNYSFRAWTGAANEGIPIARNFDELVAIIKELSQ